MTASPQPPARPLTVAEYAALGETEPGYTELVEGHLLSSPSPAPDHNAISLELAVQLRPQLPEHLEIIQDVDLDLELAPPDAPGFVRRPDLIITSRGARRRVRTGGGLLRASEVSVVIEIVSPSSRRTDYVSKRGEYDEAGIPHYWIVDPALPVTVLACHQAGELGYADSGEVTGTFEAADPFEIRIDLAELA